jgi:hypothetical protein
MSMSNDELVLLVDRYLDGELTDAERQRLSDDQELAKRFIAELRFQGRVGGLLRQDGNELLEHVEGALDLDRSSVLADRVIAQLHPPRSRRWWRLAAGALVAASVAVVVMFSVGSSTGVVAAVADGLNTTSPKVDLRPGSQLSLSVNQEAQVAFKDGTRMDLGATSSVRLAGIDKAGARIELEKGSLSAEVTKQPKGSHFQVETSDALLTVLGTKFTAMRMPWGTRVEVTEGRVRTKRGIDGNEVEIGAGSRVDVIAGALTLQPIRPPLPPDAQVLEPTADSVVVGGKYGDENRGLRPSHVVTSAKTISDELRDFYLRFDLSQVKQAPAHAELRLHLTLMRRENMKLHLARVEQPWKETTITWNNRPPRGERLATWIPDRHDNAIDLTAAVKANLGGELNLCLHIDEQEDADAILGFNTREAPAMMRPQLVIER